MLELHHRSNQSDPPSPTSPLQCCAQASPPLLAWLLGFHPKPGSTCHHELPRDKGGTSGHRRCGLNQLRSDFSRTQLPTDLLLPQSLGGMPPAQIQDPGRPQDPRPLTSESFRALDGMHQLWKPARVSLISFLITLCQARPSHP